MTNKFKRLIIKRAREQKVGLDIEGDVIRIFDKVYLVNIINDEVMEVL
jgi:hypothetical protein